MDRARAASAPMLMPGISVYADLRRENYAYVDKTRKLKLLLDSGKYLFLAQPRRFGKTLMISTIECMYQGHLPRLRHPDGDLVRPSPKCRTRPSSPARPGKQSLGALFQSR